MRANIDLRQYAKEHDVFLWEVADGLRIQESSLSKKLRRKFSEADKEKFIKTVDKIAAARGGDIS